MEGLHEAVSGLLAKGNNGNGDDTSVISDLSELSGAIGSVVVLPQRLPELGTVSKVRKSTSVLDLSEVSSTKVRSDLLMVPSSKSFGTSPQHKMLAHCRRKSMSETNLARLCLDETDEELDAREDDLDDIRPVDQPKDRTSSSGSYNSYRSTDSGVRLSASPSNYDQSTVRRFVTKSDSIDSGVRACVKDDQQTNREQIIQALDTENFDCKTSDAMKRNMGVVEEEPDINARVGAWCLQSAKARKSFFLKNLSAATIPSNREKMLSKTLSRTFSESHREFPERSGMKEEYKKAMENPILTTKHTTVYEEIKDVLKPLSEKKQEKEHEYEDLEKIRKDIKRSYSFQEKSQPPPPLPPRRPKSFSPDPWVDGSIGKTATLRKIFGLSFHNKSHSQDSMLEYECSGLGEERLSGTSMASADVATVQVLGTLPRPRRRTAIDIYERHQSFSSSPRMSPKQKLRNPFGISPSRSPRIPRPKNLFIFKSSNNDENSASPSSQAALRYQRQMMMQAQKTPSTDSSLADISTPDTPKPSSYYRSGYRPDSTNLETPDTGDESSAKEMSSSFSLKSPKIMSKTFSFLRKYPKEKYGSLERKRKSVIAIPQAPAIGDSSAKVPNSFSLDSFSVDAAANRKTEECNQYRTSHCSTNNSENCPMVDGNKKGTNRKQSVLPPPSASIMIPRSGGGHDRGSSISPATTPSSLPACSSLGRPGTPPATDLPLRNFTTNRQPSAASIWSVPGIPSISKQSSTEDLEPHYANLGPDPDYMTVEEITGAFRKTAAIPRPNNTNPVNDPGGYLSMGDIRQLKAMPDGHNPRPSEHEYMSMDDIQTTLYTSEYPKVCGSATSSMDRRQTHHHHPHHHPYVAQLRQMHHQLAIEKANNIVSGVSATNTSGIDNKPANVLPSSLIQKSAPGSRKTSCCEGISSEYLTPQEVGRLLRRELLHTATSRTRQELDRSHPHQPHSHH